LVTRYELKKALLRPYSARVRRRLGDLDPLSRSMLELHYYRRPMLDFMGTTATNRDILTDADLDASSVVLDVGAYVGDFAAPIRARYGATVHAFEPLPDAWVELEKRLGADEGAILHHYGLAASSRRATLAHEGPGSTVFDAPGTFGTIDIELRDIVATLDELGLDEVDLLKVNIEGGEFELFERLIETDSLGRFRQLSVQFHEWHPDAYRRRAAIRRAFARTHWEAWDYPWVWEFWTRR
jgi:FkbM family methyltransferase